MMNTVTSINEIQACIKYFLGALDSNLSAANEEYLNGSISKGAYETVLIRNSDAHLLASSDKINCPIALLGAFSLTTLDLKTHFKDVEPSEMDKSKLVELRKLFIDNGFNRSCPIFNVPVLDDGISAGKLFKEAERDFLKPIDALPTGTLLTLVTLKRGSSVVEISGEAVGILPDAVKEALRSGMLELDSSSGNNPDLSARYDTYIKR
ncbi:hypothetical protein [Vibrio owensii]|uniref:hypothetical protein n=1 Tax=Vibrio harveyi group TaxID=717610 RepID=UPI003CC58B8A